MTIDSKQATHFYSNLSIKLPRRMRNGAYRFSRFLGHRFSEAAPYGATGYLKRTILKSHRKGKNEWIIKAPHYLGHLEAGTSPHFIPRTVKTELWAKRHGMTFGKMKLIIATRGTKPSQFQTQEILRHSMRKFKDIIKEELIRAGKESKGG